MSLSSLKFSSSFACLQKPLLLPSQPHKNSLKFSSPPSLLSPLSISSSPAVSPAAPLLPILCPSLAHANVLFFKSAFQVEVVVADDEPEEKLIARFRSKVLRAGVLQECKRRRFFESNQDKRKRKTRDAARRFRKRRPKPKASEEVKQESVKRSGYNSGDDNWEFQDVEIPYCWPRLL